MLEIEPKIGFIGRDRQSVLEDLDFATKNGFNFYEIQGKGIKFDFSPKTIKQIKKFSQAHNISLNLHTIQYLNSIASSILELSQAAVKFLKKEIILANKIGAQRIIIHSGEKDDPKRKDLIDKNSKILIKNLREIVSFARKYKIKIGLENGFGSKKLCRKPSELLKVLNSVKNLRVTFDIGHANALGFDPIKYFKKIKKFVINVHLHDNNGKMDEHALIGKGNINFKEFLKECKNSNYYGPFIFEFFPRKNILKGKEIFLDLWNQIN